MGEFSALLTAIFWTVTSLSFESAGKRVGSLSVNLIRLILAFFLYAVYLKITRGMFLPLDAGLERWIWLSLSGLVGFVVGDLLLFQAFVVIGARISMLIMSLSPPITALISWLMLGEILTPMNWLGMTVTLTGIVMVVLKRGEKSGQGLLRRKIVSSYSLKGILLALGGAAGQAAGLVLSKKGMGSYDAFASSQIRVLSGLAGFLLIILVMKRWPMVARAFRNKPAMKRIVLGSVFGPFLGVSFSLLAVQHTRAGIAATIMAIVPVLIIPPAVILFKEKVNWKEIAGAIITVGGIMLFFL
ncbi:MAG: DMT family transporter [Bacteroidota bacterium]|nr:DMT family transporter [Bacteroidota bacterium]HOG95120.1 DMT family transporter [Prolixibacteraceae bacterium]HOS00933.1 DMT family transporter [Prolixibacteraceae bacterium]HOS90676.1 DMT family transporter [Prolixibacteraceae bacterium]HOY92999.1 DMT family transporter [Prolixibacteraceae bacterium]